MKAAYTLLFIVALWLVQCLVGGTRPAYCIPSYGILALAAVLSVFSLRRSGPGARPNLACLATSVAVFAYFLIRAFFSPVDYLWWMDFYLVLACLVVYLLTALYITGPGLRMVVVVGLFLLAIAEFIVAIRQFNLGDNWMPFGFSRPSTGARASGMFISPIQLAGYLEAVGAMAVSLTVWTSWKGWVRIVFGYFAVMCYAGVAISGSRGGYMSSLFSLVVFAVLTAWTLRRISPERFAGSFIVTLIALAAFVGAALFAMQQSKLLAGRLHSIGDLGVRTSNWGAAVDQWATAPAFGTGAGTHLYYGRYFRRPEIQADPEHAHSDYLETLAEYGVVGLAGMSFLVFIHCYSGLLAVGASAKAASAEPFAPMRDNRLALQMGALSAIATYFVHSMTDFNLHVPGNALMFAFFFGIMANPDPETLGAPAAAASPDSRTRFFQFLLPALGACILVICGPRFRGDYWTERARAALHYRDARAAAAFAQKALNCETRNPFTYYLLGQAWARLSQAEPNPVRRRELLEKSVTATRSGLLIFAQDEQALALLARVLDSLKRYREAGQVYERAIAVDPRLAKLHAYYARHLAAVGRLEEAEAQLARAEELDGTRDFKAFSKGTPLDPAAEPEPM